MKNRILSLPDYLCDPSGTIFCVYKRRTKLAKKCVNLIQSLTPTTTTLEELKICFDKREISSIPNFVCDASGKVFCVNHRKTRQMDAYIQFALFFTGPTTTNSEKSITSKSPNCCRTRHWFHLPHFLIKQQQYMLKAWTIAIVLKQLLVVRDLWTYKLGLTTSIANPPPGILQQ